MNTKLLQDNLTLLRKAAGWTAVDLANTLGVTRQTIYNLESGVTNLSKTQYIALKEIFRSWYDTHQNNVALGYLNNMVFDPDNHKYSDFTVALLIGAVETGLDGRLLEEGIEKFERSGR